MSKYQPKVEQTEKYSDSQDEHVVCRGKLIFIDLDEKRLRELKASNGQFIELRTDKGTYYWIEPIIISETEEIKEGEKMYSITSNRIIESADSSKDFNYPDKLDFGWRKILALPEHFPVKHLQAIASGKMKDKDEVLIKCIYRSIKKGKSVIGHTPAGEPTYIGDYDWWHEIHLDQQNHITLFPAKQSLEEVADEWSINPDNVHPADSYIAKEAFIAGAEWAKKNK